MPQLALDPNAYYLKNAATLAVLADAAYLANEAELQRKVQEQTVLGRHLDTFSLPREVQALHEYDTLGFVTSDARNVVLAFRGTAEWADVLADLDTLPRDIDGTRIHGGFAEYYDEVAQNVLTLLSQHRARDKHVWITGHSLGGALATLAAANLNLEPNRHDVFTFGQPAVGDAAFAARYKRSHHRLIYDQDPVPLVPLQVPLGGLVSRLLGLFGWTTGFPKIFDTTFVHVGAATHFDDAGKLVAAMPGMEEIIGELRQLLFSRESLSVTLKNWLLTKSADHHMANYIQSCRNAAASAAPQTPQRTVPRRRAA